MNWDKTKHIFADTEEGKMLQTSFTFTGKKKRILSINSNCTCTTHQLTGDVLYVQWKINVRHQPRPASTSLTVEYNDGTIDDLEMETNVFIKHT